MAEQYKPPYTLKRRISPPQDEHNIDTNSILSILCIGGSAGIGRCLCKQIEDKLKDKRYRIFVSGSRPQLSVNSAKIVYESIDLTKEGYIDQFRTWLFQKYQVTKLDLVIYCAGIADVGEFVQQSKENICDIIEINYIAPVKLTKLFQPYLIKGSFSSLLSLWSGVDGDVLDTNKKGKIVYLGSPSTLYPTPDYMIYSATKAALQQFAVNLRYEYGIFGINNGIDVSLINPPTTNTTKFWKPNKTASKALNYMFHDDYIIKLWLYNIGIFYIGFFFNFLAIISRLFSFVFQIVFRVFKYEKRGSEHVNKASHLNKKDLIITGGSRGLGASLISTFQASSKWNIVNIHKNENKRHKEHKSIQCDLSNNESAAQVMNDDAVTNCDVFVHNAAINISGNFHDLTMKQIDTMLRLNFVTPILMVHDALNRFKNKKIVFVFIASLTNYVFYPFSCVYGSTKIGIANFAQSLGIELFCKSKYNGSDVLVICPGAMNTNMARSNSPNPGSRSKGWLNTDDVARFIYRRIEGRYLSPAYFIPTFLFNRVVVIGWKEYFFSWLATLFPIVFLPIMTKVFKKK